VSKTLQAKDFERRYDLAMAKAEELLRETAQEALVKAQLVNQEHELALQSQQEEHEKCKKLLQVDFHRQTSNLEKMHAHAFAEQAQEQLAELTSTRTSMERAIKSLQGEHANEKKKLEREAAKVRNDCACAYMCVMCGYVCMV